MSPRRAAAFLWLLLFALLPLPYFALEAGREPGVKLLVFTAATGAAAVAEPSGVASIVAALFAAQTLAYAVVLYLLVGWLTRRLHTSRARALLVAGVALILAGAALFPIYLTPFSRTALRPNLLGLFW